MKDEIRRIWIELLVKDETTRSDQEVCEIESAMKFRVDIQHGIGLFVTGKDEDAVRIFGKSALHGKNC